jgi:plasmid stability protein
MAFYGDARLNTCHPDHAMKRITIRRLEDSLVQNIKDRAKQHRRSLQSEVRQLLIKEYGNPRDPWKLIRNFRNKTTPAMTFEQLIEAADDHDD